MKKVLNSQTLIGILIGIAVVVIIVVLLIGLPSSKAPNKTMTSGGGLNTSTGAGTSLITQSQANLLFGAGGIYKEVGGMGSSIKFFNGTLNLPVKYLNSLTGVWGMGYNYTIRSANRTATAIEVAFESSNPTGLYAYMLQNLTRDFVRFSNINSSSNGLIYSYMATTNAFLNVTLVIGVKDNIVIYLLVLGDVIGENSLAPLLASDIP